MNAAAESQMIGRVSADKEGVRVRIVLGITVGGGKEDEDAPASGNLDVAGAVRLLRGAKEALDRRFEAQRLVDRRRHEARVRAERAPLFGVRDQGEEQVAEEVRRGLVPRQEKQEEEPEDLRLGEHTFHRRTVELPEPFG